MHRRTLRTTLRCLSALVALWSGKAMESRMGRWKAHVLGCLPPPLAAASVVFIIELLGPPSSWPGWSPEVRVAVALLVSLLNVSLAPAGEGRQRTFGFFFFVTTTAGVLRYGDLIGVHVAWQRWLLAIALSLPFWLLFGANVPGSVKTRLKAWRRR